MNSRNLIRAQGSVASLMELNRRKPRPQSRQPRKLSAKHLLQGSHRWRKSQRTAPQFLWFLQNFPITPKKWIDIDIYTYLYWTILQSQTFWWIQSLMSPHVIVKYQHFNELQKWTNYTTKKCALSYISLIIIFSPVTYLIFDQGTSMDFVRSPSKALPTHGSPFLPPGACSGARLSTEPGTSPCQKARKGARAGDFELLQLQEDILIMYNIIYIYMYNILGKNIKQQSKVHVETSNPTRCRIMVDADFSRVLTWSNGLDEMSSEVRKLEWQMWFHIASTVKFHEKQPPKTQSQKSTFSPHFSWIF